MNKIFKVIWNHATQSWVATSELSRSKGKTKSLSTAKSALAAAIAVAATSGSAYAAMAVGGTGAAVGTTGNGEVTVVTGGSATAGTAIVSGAAKGLAIGENANVTFATTNAGLIANVSSIAIGNNVKALDSVRGMVLGTNATLVGANAVVIGNNATAIKNEPNSDNGLVVIGSDALIRNVQSAGQSRGSTAIGSNSLAGLLTDAGVANGTAVSTTSADYNTQTGGFTPGRLMYRSGMINTAGTTVASLVSNEATAIGFDSRAVGDQSVAIGAQTVAGHASVAIGGNDIAVVQNSTNNGIYKAIVGADTPINRLDPTTGTFNTTCSTANTWFETTYAKDGSVAIGAKAHSNALYGTALGTAAYVQADADLGTAIGTGARVGSQTQTVDANLTVTADFTTKGGVAIAAGSVAERDYTTAVGTGSKANQTSATAMGYQALASGVNATAVGAKAVASAADALAYGGNATSYATNSVAVGTNSTVVAGADSSIAFGTDTSVSGVKTVALGSNIRNVSTAGSVVLGDSSSGVVGTTGASHAVGTVPDAVITSTNGATVTYGGFKGQPKDAGKYVSIGAVGAERQLKNVAAGNIDANSTDGINGSQLYSIAVTLGNQVFQSTYFHVNNITNAGTGDATTNLGNITDAAGATGQYAVTAGVNATANGTNGTAIGHGALSTGSAVVVGASASAIGVGSPYGANGAVAIGEKATVEAPTGSAPASIAIGSEAYAFGQKISDLTTRTGEAIGVGTATVIGANAKAIDAGVAIGQAADAGLSQFATAVGVDARALGDRSTAMGVSTRATGQQASAIGWNANASGTASLSIGTNSTSSGANSVAISGMSSASGAQSMALGFYANATGTNSIALGRESGATGVQAAALTSYAKAHGKDSIAAGVGATTTDAALRGVAIARQSSVSAVDGIAIGYKSSVTAANATTLGANTVASHADAVALGSGAITREATKETQATVGPMTYGGFAGNTPKSVVSFGQAGQERQLVNVAAGNISATSTDAINGSQLYATNAILGNVATSTVKALGGNAVLDPKTGEFNVTYNLTGTDPSKSGSTGTNYTSVGAALTALSEAVNQPLTFTANTNADTDANGSQQELGSTIAIIGSKTNKTLTENTDAAVNSTYSAKNIQTVVTDNQIQIQMAENPEFTSIVVKNGADDTNPVTITSGNGTTGGTISNLATVISDPKDQTNATYPTNITTTNAATLGDVLNAGWNLQEKGVARDLVTPYDTVNFIDGAGTLVNVTTTDGKVSKIKYDVAVDDSTIKINADGKLEAVKPTITSGGKGDINFANTSTTNVTVNPKTGDISVDVVTTPLENETNGTVRTPANPDAIATAGDVANAINKSGWNVTSGATTGVVSGNSDQLINPGETVKFIAGKNIELTQDVNNFTFAVSDNPVFNSTTIGGTPTYTDAAGNKLTQNPDGTYTDAAGNIVDPADVTTVINNPITIGTVNGSNVISNLTTTLPDVITTNTTDADGNPINYTTNIDRPTIPAGNLTNAATLGDVLNAGWNLQGNGEAVDFVKPYDTVNFVNGEGTTVVTSSDGNVSNIQYNVNVDGKTTKITYVSEDGKPVTKNADGTYSNADGSPYTGPVTSQITAVQPTTQVNGNNVTGPVNLVNGNTTTVTNTPDGIKVEVNTGNTTVGTDGKAAPLAPTDADKVATVGDIIKTINNVGWFTNSTTATGGADNTKISAGQAVNFEAGLNMEVTQAVDSAGNVTYTYATKENVTFTKTVVNQTLSLGDVTKPGAPVVNMTAVNASTPVGVENGDITPAINMSNATFTGLAPNLPTTVSTGNASTSTTSQVAPTVTDAQMTNAATLGDVLNAGWNLQENGTAKDFVKPYDTVNFVNGTGTTANITTDGNVSNVTYNVKVDNETTEITYTNAAGDTIYKLADGTYNTSADGKGTTVAEGDISGSQVSAKTSPLTNNEDGTVNTPANPKALATAGDVANAINNSGFTLTTSASAGEVSGTSKELVKPGKTVTVDAGKNISVTQNAGTITVATKKDVEFDSVKAGPVTIDSKGINAGGTRVTNVAPGEAGTDAVNVNQLKQVAGDIHNKINRNNKDLRAGIAGANAAAGLPQVYIPGKSMVAASAGTFKGQSALAVGYSRASDNGKLILKLQGNANTRGDVGGSVGVGYQW